MKTNKNLLAVAAGLAGCAAVIWFSTSIQGSERTYEVHPYITTPEYRTDAARAIDAYERLMERYMDLTERNLNRIAIDIEGIFGKLDSIDAGLKDLSTQMARIEKMLGIKQPKRRTQRKPHPEPTKKKPITESAPPM